MGNEMGDDLPEVNERNLPPLDSSPSKERGVFDTEDEDTQIELTIGDVIVHQWPTENGPKQFNLIISLGGRISWDQAIAWDIERNEYNILSISKVIDQMPKPSINIDIRKDPFNLRKKQEETQE